jgi:hypothetical protein
LLGEVAEQLCAIINRAVAISVKSKKGIIRTISCPREVLGSAIVVDVEVDSMLSICEREAIAEDIY